MKIVKKKLEAKASLEIEVKLSEMCSKYTKDEKEKASKLETKLQLLFDAVEK